jgi:hypothetical protein
MVCFLWDGQSDALDTALVTEYMALIGTMWTKKNTFLALAFIRKKKQLSGGTGGRKMNHDATHCADYTTACPKSCYRAELTADLRKRTDLLWLPMSFAHFKGTEECPKYPRRAEDGK